MKILLTGGSGFVGTAVREALTARGVSHRVAVRRLVVGDSHLDATAIGEIDGATNWRTALEGVSVIIHLAARVHVMRETALDGLAEFRRVNVRGTENLARAAASVGARRLIYVSSIKVNGEATSDRPFTATDPPHPEGPYGISKWEAEQALARLATETGLEVVVVRPPLVYGAGVRGNFLRLMKLAALGIPLPFGAVRNLRSLVFVRNLADALVACARASAAANRTFLVSDGEDLSTADVCARLSRSLGRTPRLFPVPRALASALAGLAGREPEARRLFGSLQVDASPIRRELGWAPPYTVDQGFAEMAAWFRAR